MKQHRLSFVVVTALALALAFAPARSARAQAGDLDIISRTTPPDVVIMMDSSGSMANLILPPQYIVDRVAGGLVYPNMVWFNKSNDVTNFPASYIAPGYSATTYPTGWWCGKTTCTAGNTTFDPNSTTEDYRPTCQIFPSTTEKRASKSACYGVATPSTTTCKNPTPASGSTTTQTIGNDDADDKNPAGGTTTIACWNLPGGCSLVPSGLTCVNTPAGTSGRKRYRTSSTYVTSQSYTTITFPNVSEAASGTPTLIPPNYLWWMVQQIYKGVTPMPTLYMGSDRNGAAKAAITQLVNNINPDGLPPKVRFGLARYDMASNNGGYLTVPVDLNNKTALLTAVQAIHSNGRTPLSETLVDIGRYYAGADKLGSYPAYNRNTSGGTTGTIPPSPISSSCEKLFAIMVTDGLPTADCNDHFGTGTPGSTFKSVFGPYMEPNDPQCADTPPNGFLDDVAAGLYAKDLRSTVSGNQNVITYTVGFTVDSPLLSKAAARGNGIYFQSNNADELADALTGAIQDIISKNTTLSSATVPASRTAFDNGFYTAYFLPSGHKSVWPGHLEAYTMNSSLVVVDKFGNPAIDPATNLFYEPRKPYWDVAQTLVSGYNSRTLYTNKGGTRRVLSTANLVEPNDPNAAAKLTPTDLGLTSADLTLYPQPSTHISVTDPNKPTSLVRLGGSIIDFARGADSFDEDNDGDRTEVRDWIFGDVFHSSPLAIGPPMNAMRFETNYGPASDSNSFMGRYLLRDRVLYVGANDGFLHALRAGSFVDPTPTVGDEYYTPGDGSEIFGYIPATLLPKLKSLPRDDIAKVYYVDGAPTAADAWIDYNGNGTKEGDDWTTVMMVPLREGGEGMMALDVTNPAATSGNHGPYPRLMWEFTDAGLGQTWSRPIITRVKMRGAFGTGDKCGANDGDGDCVETWVAIFGAGYRHESNPNNGLYITDPNNATAKKGRGVYMVKISDGTVLAHLEYSPTTSDPLNRMSYAITAEPAVLDLNGDGFADVIYVGDLGGQMWKWVIQPVGVLTSGKVPTSVWPAGILFQSPVADLAAGAKHYHSIFTGAAAAYLKGVLSLSFGSGERADLGYMGTAGTDPNDIIGPYDDNNRFWVVLDRAPLGSGAFPSTLPIYEVPTTGHQNLTDLTYINTTDPDPTDAGYFFRVPDGHKFITDPLVFNGQAFSLTYLPDPAGAGVDGSCALGGSTFQWAFTLSNGIGVLDDPSSPATIRGAMLSSGAPTNPRITVAKGPDGKPIVKITVQTSTGALPPPPKGPAPPNPVETIFWRQAF